MGAPITVDCARHGTAQSSAIVCGHLAQNRGKPIGFIENSDAPDDKQAWCYACELVYSQEQERTDRFDAFCDFVVVCMSCYDEIKAHHDFDAMWSDA